MVLRITRVRFDPALYEMIMPIARDALATMERLPGLQRVDQGVDLAAGCVVTVSTWDREEHARFSPEALGEPVRRLRSLGVWRESVEIYTILDGTGPSTAPS